MKSISNLVNNAQIGASHSYHEPSKVAVTRETAMVVNELFNQLKATSPAWQAAFPSAELEASAKRDWIQAFAENGIVDTAQTKLALKKRRAWAQPWFPSVGQFLEWCKPSLADYGLLPTEQALSAVINGKKKSHVVLFAAAKATGTWALKSMNHKDLLKLFGRNYEIACARFIDGEDLTMDIPKALPENVTRITSVEQALINAQKIRQLFNNKNKRVNHANG
jgi:hypothetical protein